MLRGIHKNKGVALFLVLGTILMILAFANVMLLLMNSQTRLARHQVARIQAQYVAQAATNYALERLRLPPASGGWTYATCAGGCAFSLADWAGISHLIRGATIRFCTPGQPNCPYAGIPVNLRCRVPAGMPAGYNFCVHVRITYRSFE